MSAPRRILFVDHTAVMGGGEIALLHLARSLPDEYEPLVALLSTGPLAEKLTDAGIRTFLIEAGSAIVQARRESLSPRRAALSLIPTILRIARLIKETKADLVYCNSLKADILGGLAARLAGRPVIWHIRDRIADDYLPAFAVGLLRNLAQWLPTHLIANSHATLQTLDLFDESRGTVIYSGLDLAPYLRIPPRLPGKMRIGIIGRLSSWKGQHIFLQAAALLRPRFPAATFQIIGSPLFSETEYEASLHARAASLGVADITEFAGFRNDIPRVLEELDVVVHASTTPEPFGQVAVLAMASARPLVATAAGGILETVQDGMTGSLVPMGNAAAMAAAICDMLQRPAWAADMAQAGRRRAAELFDIHRTAAQTAALYGKIIG